MKSNHTPGPWHVSCLATDTPNAPGSETLATVADLLGHTVATLARRGAAANDNANARLIAAAPAMLAALKELAAIAEAGAIERRETGKPSWNIMDAIKATTGEAIAKAEGRE